MITTIVTGNIGRDAETRAAGKDTVTSFSVASTGKVKGEKVTTWVDCSVWGKRGESLRQYLTKGTRVAVVGELSTREHNGKTYLQVRVGELDLMGGGKGGGSGKRDDSPPDDDATPGFTRHAVEDTKADDDDGSIPF